MYRNYLFPLGIFIHWLEGLGDLLLLGFYPLVV